MMKVKITKESRRSLYMSQEAAARAVVDSARESDDTVEEWARSAAVLVLESCDDFIDKVITAEASVMPNSRIGWDAFCTGSENLDVWIEGSAKGYNTFCEFGAYLSDLWGVCHDNHSEVLRHMFKVIYKRA